MYNSHYYSYRKQYLKINCQKTQKGSKLYKVRIYNVFFFKYTTDNHPRTFCFTQQDGGWTMYVSGNASSFAVLSAARYAVFDRHAKKSDEAYWNSSSAPICPKTFSRVLQASNSVQGVSSSETFIPKVS